MDFTPADFNRLVMQRRSVFPSQFDTSKKVEDAIVHQIIWNATWAPNHGQTEPWYFKVFTGEGIKSFAGLQGELYRESAGDAFDPKKFKKLTEQPLLASHIISIGMKRTTTRKIAEIEEIEAVACAVQNIYLSVAAYGLGGYWSSGGITYLEKAKYHFGLSAADKLLGFFYIAHVAVPSPAGKRRPIAEKVAWVTDAFDF